MARTTRLKATKAFEKYRLYRDVEIPLKKQKRRLYPHAEMEVGEMYIIKRVRWDRVVKRHADAASAYGKRHGKKFIFRKVDEGYACWRIR